MDSADPIRGTPTPLYELLRLLPPRPDDDDRVRPDDRLPPAPFFFELEVRVADRPVSFAVLRSTVRRSLRTDSCWLPPLRRVDPPRCRLVFDELLRPLAMWRFSFRSHDCKERAYISKICPSRTTSRASISALV
jgi:hypothetical protein